jgi:hypothetical protein
MAKDAGLVWTDTSIASWKYEMWIIITGILWNLVFY